MRLAVLATFVAVVSARRGMPSTSAPAKRNSAGWNLPEEKTEKVKEVKRVKHEECSGWFGHKYDPEHPCWKDIEAAFDGLE